jgi:hypothetical protein
MKHIFTNKGTAIVVDEQDYAFLNQHTWWINNGYARTIIDGQRIYMHRLITGASNFLVVDHINHNTLDNRRDNLRVCTQKENLYNRKPRYDNPYEKGVSKSASGKFRARIKLNGKEKYLGTFDTPEDAGRAYLEAADLIQRDFAYIKETDSSYNLKIAA